jgi:hypothetical protein
MCINFVLTSKSEAFFEPETKSLSVAFGGDGGDGNGVQTAEFAIGDKVDEGTTVNGKICGCPSDADSWKVVVTARLKTGTAWNFKFKVAGSGQTIVPTQTCNSSTSASEFCTVNWEISLSDVVGSVCGSHRVQRRGDAGVTSTQATTTVRTTTKQATTTVRTTTKQATTTVKTTTKQATTTVTDWQTCLDACCRDGTNCGTFCLCTASTLSNSRAFF